MNKTSLVTLYQNNINDARRILGEYAGLFGDNGGEPDGPSYYRPATDFPQELIDQLVSAKVGYIQTGYETSLNSFSDIDLKNIKGWCGYQCDNIVFFTLIGEQND